MAEHMSKAQFQAMDHHLGALKSWPAEPIPEAQPMDPAAFHAMDHAAEHGLKNPADPGFPPMGPQPDVSGEGSQGK